jgi:hypothetical protein
VRKEAVQPLLRQQRACHHRGLVGQAGQLEAGVLQRLQALQHARVHRRVLAVDQTVVLLVTRIGLLVQARRRAGVGQHLRDQVLGTFADGAADEVQAHRRPAQVGQRQRERGFEIAGGVDHGAVQVDDGGIEGMCLVLRGGRVHRPIMRRLPR